MQFAPTVLGPLDVAAAKGKKHSTKREHIVARAVSREIPKGTEMARGNEINMKYAQAMVGFKTRLAADLQKASNGNIVVNIETGRKFDKVSVGTLKEGSDKVKLEVRYFVDQRDGSIYGMKSPLAPNLNHFYGTIYDSEKWDWSGDRAVPFDLDKAGVVEVGGYGDYKHYVRATDKAAVAAG